MNRKSILTVDLEAISHNAAVLKSYLKPETKLMAVVKADAYGHGAVKAAEKISSVVYGFAVNDIQEGIELRENNIKEPILVFEPPAKQTVRSYKEYDLIATASDLQHFQNLPAGTCYHLNFNTGMGRIGFRPEQANQVAGRVKKRDDLHCRGIYSHFPAADEMNSTKGKEQVQRLNEIRAHFGENLMTHICNTAGIVQHPKGHFQMVRTGIGLYGYAPGDIDIPGLIPALTWKTHLVQVTKIKKGEPVSYGSTWQAPEDGYCGVIPVGYSDGIPRSLAGKFEVSISGNIYPVVGRVTMNYCIVYLGHAKIENGAEVSLLGENHTARNWAAVAGTIPYEILTSISPRIPRRFING